MSHCIEIQIYKFKRSIAPWNTKLCLYYLSIFNLSLCLPVCLSLSLCLSVSLFVCLSLLPLERVVSVVGGAGLESGSPLVKKSARGIRKSRQTTTRILHTFTFTEIQREMMICYYSIVNNGAAENRHRQLLSLYLTWHFSYTIIWMTDWLSLSPSLI